MLAPSPQIKGSVRPLLILLYHKILKSQHLNRKNPTLKQGEHAKDADQSLLAQAEELEAPGATSEDIRQN